MFQSLKGRVRITVYNDGKLGGERAFPVWQLAVALWIVDYLLTPLTALRFPARCVISALYWLAHGVVMPLFILGWVMNIEYGQPLMMPWVAVVCACSVLRSAILQQDSVTRWLRWPTNTRTDRRQGMSEGGGS